MRTYQLATEPNATNAEDGRNFSHASIRRIRAEVMLDCITQVTEIYAGGHLSDGHEQDGVLGFDEPEQEGLPVAHVDHPLHVILGALEPGEIAHGHDDTWCGTDARSVLELVAPQPDDANRSDNRDG